MFVVRYPIDKVCFVPKVVDGLADIAKERLFLKLWDKKE